MIEFRNVSKSFWTGTQRKVILDQASFKIELGRSMGILAPNGTGKTTIINMMAGLEQPDEGKIFRTSRISFPLGFMGGVVASQKAPRYVGGLGGCLLRQLAPLSRRCSARRALRLLFGGLIRPGFR